MHNIVITFTINGYIIEQNKKGFDWTNRWVAETNDSLIKVISDIVEKHWQEEAKREAKDAKI